MSKVFKSLGATGKSLMKTLDKKSVQTKENKMMQTSTLGAISKTSGGLGMNSKKAKTSYS